MKIGFNINVDKKDADSGKHKFLIRLAAEFRKRNIKITNNNPDIFLFLPAKEFYIGGKKKVLRLDGLILNTRWDYKKRNKSIKNSIDKCDALVYQGQFCQDAYHKFLKVKKKKEKIISNGASPSEFLRRKPKNFFLANCKWRPHKRFKTIIKSFIDAFKQGINSNLIVTGKPEHKIIHSKIKYVGWQNKEQIKKLLAGAIASFHLSWLDWCPNSMVEAIVAGCPVIYSKSGGHEELGSKAGIGIKDENWNYKVLDLYDPPPLNKKKIVEAMFYLKNNLMIPDRKDLYIKEVATKYLNYFETLLE